MSGRKHTHGKGKQDTFHPTTICDGTVQMQTIRNDFLSLGYGMSRSSRTGVRSQWSVWHALLHGSGFDHPWLGAINESKTIAVINTGAKVFQIAEAVSYMKDVVKWVNGLRSQHQPDLRVVWRNSYPGHPGCESAQGMPPLRSLDEERAQPYLVDAQLPKAFLKVLGSSSYNLSSARLYNSWHVLNKTRPIIDSLAVGAGWHLLDAYTPSSLRPDAHLRADDCLHFCMPGPIDAWVQQLMVLLWGGLAS